MTKSNFKKSVIWRHFSDVIVIMSQKHVTKLTSQNFSILGPSQSKLFLATSMTMINVWPHLKFFRPPGCVGMATALGGRGREEFVRMLKTKYFQMH